MKIRGPKGTDGVDGIPDEARGVEGAGFRELLEVGPGTVDGSRAPGPVALVAEKLRSGEIGPDRAVEMIVEAVVQQSQGLIQPALREQLRQYLVDLLTTDPLLAETVRKLGGE